MPATTVFLNSCSLGTFCFFSLVKGNDTVCCFTEQRIIQPLTGNQTKMFGGQGNGG